MGTYRRRDAVEYRGRIFEHDKTVRCTLTASFDVLDATKENSPGWAFAAGSAIRREKIGTKDRKNLLDTGKKHFHVRAI